MEETTNSTAEKAPKKNWFKGLKSEFKKIIWLDRDTLVKQSVTVVGVTVILGAIIYVLDAIVEFGIGKIIG